MMVRVRLGKRRGRETERSCGGRFSFCAPRGQGDEAPVGRLRANCVG
jgi:hypothetical protein